MAKVFYSKFLDVFFIFATFFLERFFYICGLHSAVDEYYVGSGLTSSFVDLSSGQSSDRECE